MWTSITFAPTDTGLENEIKYMEIDDTVDIGKEPLTINGEGKVTSRGYTHNESFPKYNGAAIDCNLFCREDFRCISGILFTDADLFEEYTTKNTWLFLNPFTTIKIPKKDFSGAVYWSADKYGNYLPRCRGKRL